MSVLVHGEEKRESVVRELHGVGLEHREARAVGHDDVVGAPRTRSLGVGERDRVRQGRVGVAVAVRRPHAAAARPRSRDAGNARRASQSFRSAARRVPRPRVRGGASGVLRSFCALAYVFCVVQGVWGRPLRPLIANVQRDAACRPQTTSRPSPLLGLDHHSDARPRMSDRTRTASLVCYRPSSNRARKRQAAPQREEETPIGQGLLS